MPWSRALRDLSSRPQPSVEPRAVSDLAARLGAAGQATGKMADLEGRLAKAEAAAAVPRPVQSDPALAARIAALETAAPSAAQTDPALAARIAGLETTAREAKSRADAAFEAAQKNAAALVPASEVEALAARIATLEATMKAAEARIATTAGADKAGRLAFVAVSLRAIVERGDPFAQELAPCAAGADAKILAPLEPFAAGGSTARSSACARTSQLNGAMLAATGSAPRDGGFIDRLRRMPSGWCASARSAKHRGRSRDRDRPRRREGGAGRYVRRA